MKTSTQRRKVAKAVPPDRKDHAMVKFKGQLIPVLGTVGGTKEESEETARNIERYFTR